MTDYFQQTSNEPYLRHDYKIYYTNKKPEIFDNYEDVKRIWFETPNQFLNYVEVLDYKKSNKSKVKGF